VFAAGITGHPAYIAAGPDGNVWFTESLVLGSNTASRIGRITPNGTVTEFESGAHGGGPAALEGIAAGPDGNLWFTGAVGQEIGRISPTGTVTEFASGVHCAPFGITAGADGNLWFTEAWLVGPSAGKIGRITSGGAVTEFPLPTAPKCIVPKLKGNTLAVAESLIARAHCKPGPISRPRRTSHRKLVVVSQKPATGKTLPAGSRIALRLA